MNLFSNQPIKGLDSSAKALRTNTKNYLAIESRQPQEVTLQQKWITRSAASNNLGNANTLQSDQDNLRNWIARNIQDKGLRSTILSRIVDGILDRTDMISIFRSAKDGNRVDKKELRDLRKTTSHGNQFSMPEYVQVLSRKIAFGDYANRNYQDKSLGNLRESSTGSHLEKLVGKWFFGKDRPTNVNSLSHYPYQRATGSLFDNGVSYSDVIQGKVGSCYFLSGLAATALRSPEQIQNMFTDNGDGTFTVRFYKDNGAADYVTVDRSLPFNPATGTSLYADYSQELWVALAEKAYAQWNASGVGKNYWGDKDYTNSYQAIWGGNPSFATHHITGRQTGENGMFLANSNAVLSSFQSGQLVMFGSRQTPTSAKVVGNHAYTLVDYDAVTRQFTLYNPWGVDGTIASDSSPNDGKIQLTWAELSRNFDTWNFTV